MKNIYLFIIFVFSVSLSNAQFVTIPDANFVIFLENTFPACMTGNQMDTTCNGIVNATAINCSNLGISSLDGIQYFDNLLELKASSNSLTTLPNLTNSSLVSLELNGNQFVTITSNQFPPNLQKLKVSSNQNLTSIAVLPLSLIEFNAGNSPNLALPFFHNGLEVINLPGCNLTTVPQLPNTLLNLFLEDNPLVSIAASSLPNSLLGLSIGNCDLNQLPSLPPNLDFLNCNQNNFTTISNLPSTLTKLFASNNPNLTTVSNLPDSMVNLIIENCALTSIDTIPTICSNLLNLANNNLTHIPNFPQNVLQIKLGDNDISSIPNFPSSLSIFLMPNNNISCWPIFPNLLTINIQGNPFLCIPNYILSMSVWPSLNTVPICNLGNLSTNPLGCQVGYGIRGNLFKDDLLDCQFAGWESPLVNAQVKLYDTNGVLVETTSSTPTGDYFLTTSNFGIYSVEIDTVNKSFATSCAFPGADSLVTLSALDTVIHGVDFGFICRPGFDVGVHSVNTNGWVSPGQDHTLNVSAGDLSQWHGFNCGSVGGTVSITVNGPVVYTGIPALSLTPTVNGSTYTYTIANFGTASIFQFFRLNFQTDSLAQSGDSICVTVDVTPLLGDVNPSNNTYSFCYNVVNSYDPNDKQVYPKTVSPDYDDWLTYTIRFQNTGTAPAFIVILEDTLSSLLDYETFEVIGYKHPNSYNLIDDRLVVYFPNIMLPDSASDFQESIGYFQYRIKPISGLQHGTEIENKAYIFFDYNDPIITNTAITSYIQADLSIGNLNSNQFVVFPNPSTGQFYLKMDGDYTVSAIEVYNMMGQTIPVNYTQNTNLTEIEVLNNTKGFCLINIITNQGIISKKMFIE